MKKELILFAFLFCSFYCTKGFSTPVDLPKLGEARRYDIFERVAFEKLNAVRRALDLPELSWNELLADSAHKHNLYMLANPSDVGHIEYSSKAGFFGATPDERIRNIGYKKAFLGEAVAQVPFDKGRFIVEGLIDAPYHRLTLLNPQFEEVGVSILCKGEMLDVWHNATCFATFNFGGNKEKKPVVFPCNSVKVRTFFDCTETPSPCVNLAGDVKQTGYVITFQNYPENLRVSLESATTIYPHSDKNRAGSDYILVVPHLPLAPNSRFEFEARKKCEFFTYSTDNFNILFEPQALKVKGKGEHSARMKIVGEGVNGFRGRKIRVNYSERFCKFELALLPAFESDGIFYLRFNLKERGDCQYVIVELEPDLPIPQTSPIAYKIDISP